SPATANITIFDNDAQPSLMVDDMNLIEGNSGQRAMTFTVRLSAASGLPVTVNYATADKNAVAGLDYVAANGSVTFAAGETSKTVPVNVLGDQATEKDEELYLNLSGPSGATLADSQALGTILNDDNSVRIKDASALEGNNGTTAFTFMVRLAVGSV